MGKINYGKVVLGGVVAGIVFLLTDWAGMAILPFDWEAWIQERNLTMPPMALWIVMDLLFGILMVWLYAAIRPRFGAGVKTAIIAAAWATILVALMHYGFAAMGLWPMNTFWMMALWGFVQFALATSAGAWVYKEEGAA